MSIRERLYEDFHGHVGRPGHRGGSAPAGSALDKSALLSLDKQGKRAFRASAAAVTLSDVNKAEKQTAKYQRKLRVAEKKGWHFRMPRTSMGKGSWKYTGIKNSKKSGLTKTSF